MKRHRLLQGIWYLTNFLFFGSVIFLIYSIGWEYSTRQYLRGFSDAIVPVSGTPMEKINAILLWMQKGPARRTEATDESIPQRNPEETLNYQALLHVCGTATNAFVNLANSSGLPSRRLLLLDENRIATHVVAEVLVAKHWIIVDPAFHFIPRGANGDALTREDLGDATVFRKATAGIPGYDASYDYDITSHIRLGRVPVIGRSLRRVLDRFFPGWEDSVYWTLLLERESFAALALAILATLFLFVLRAILRWYCEKRLGIHQIHMREQLLRAARVFMGGTS